MQSWSLHRKVEMKPYRYCIISARSCQSNGKWFFFIVNQYNKLTSFAWRCHVSILVNRKYSALCESLLFCLSRWGWWWQSSHTAAVEERHVSLVLTLVSHLHAPSLCNFLGIAALSVFCWCDLWPDLDVFVFQLRWCHFLSRSNSVSS